MNVPFQCEIMIEICFLGTAGAIATEERDNASFLLKHDERLILIDCPGSLIQKIKKFKFDPRKVHSILVTHIHPDHIYGLASFVHSLMLDDCFIQLFGSEETVNFCRSYRDLFHLQEPKIKTRIDCVPLTPWNGFMLGDFLECTSFRVPHVSSSLAYHFFFKREKKELIYSGDTSLGPYLFQEAEDIDYLIHDCSAPSRFFKKYPSLRRMHSNAFELGQLSQKSSVKCLLPFHFFGELEFSLSEIEEEIRQNFRGTVIIPKDFDRITL